MMARITELLGHINKVGIYTIHFLDINGEYSSATLQIPEEVHIISNDSNVYILEYEEFERIENLLNLSKSFKENIRLSKVKSIVNLSRMLHGK